MVILYNPHVDDFLAEPPHFRLLRRRPLKKYGFLIDEMAVRPEGIRIIVDGEVSAFVPQHVFSRIPTFLRKIIAALEFNVWKKLNNLLYSACKVVRVEDVGKDDVILAFSYKAASGCFEKRLKYLSSARAVVFHLSHYFVSTGEKSENMRKLENVYLGGDSDISGNSYFKEHFSWYKRPFLVLPFSVAPRFQMRQSYYDRENRCVATGSFHDLAMEKPSFKYSDYMKSSGTATYHPLRRAIFKEKERLSELIACHVSPYRKYEEGVFRSFLSHFSVSQKKYFAQDIVLIYNQYKYAVVGEELSGFPALGAFEAMACGTLLLGDPSCYKGLGLVENQHYVAYDGTLPGLLSTINRIGQSDCRKIAEAGCQYVTTNFNPSAIYQRWCSQFNKI